MSGADATQQLAVGGALWHGSKALCSCTPEPFSLSLTHIRGYVRSSTMSVGDKLDVHIRLPYLLQEKPTICVLDQQKSLL